MNNNVKPLPERPSEGLKACLEDLDVLLGRKNSRYRFEPNIWHSPLGYNPTRRCLICLGGARLARIFNSPDKEIMPGSLLLSSEEKVKIAAMDEFMRFKLFEGVHKYRDDYDIVIPPQTFVKLRAFRQAMEKEIFSRCHLPLSNFIKTNEGFSWWRPKMDEAVKILKDSGF